MGIILFFCVKQFNFAELFFKFTLNMVKNQYTHTGSLQETKMFYSGSHMPGRKMFLLFIESPHAYLVACKIWGKVVYEIHVLFGTWKSVILQTHAYLRASSERPSGLSVVKLGPIKRS